MVGNTTFLAWDPVPDLDLDFYVVKYSQATSGATWGSSTVLVDQISRNSNSIPVPTLVGSYLIKAVDTSGIESETETIISSTIASLANFNVISAIVESPSFSGTKDGCGLSGTNLVITGADTVDDWTNVDDVLLWDVGNAGLEDFGLYYFVGSGSSTGSSLDLGAVYTSRLTPNIVASGTDLFGNMDLWTDVDAVSNWDGGDAAQWGVVLQVRTTNDNPSGSPTWTDWQDLIVGDYTARAFQFRLFLYTYQAGISPLVSTLGVNVDMPDRVLGDNDIVSNAVGTTITYDTAFKAAPAIAIGAQNMATGDYFAITSQSASGFSIRFFNSAGTGISRTFDWVAKGYGVAG